MIEFVERYHGFVTAFVPLLLVGDIADIKLVVENTIHAALGNRVIVDAFELTRTESPFIFSDLGNLFSRVCAGQHESPHMLDQLKAFRIRNDDAASFFIFGVQIAHRCHFWHPAFLDTTFHTANRILPQIDDELVGNATFNAEQHRVIARFVHAVDGLDGLQDIPLQHPLERSAIDRIARQTIDLPAQNPIGFAFPDALEHFFEDRTIVRLFG